MTTPFDARRLTVVLAGGGADPFPVCHVLAGLCGGEVVSLSDGIAALTPEVVTGDGDTALLAAATACFAPLGPKGPVLAILPETSLFALGQCRNSGLPRLVSALSAIRVPVVHLVQRDSVLGAVLSCIRQETVLKGAGQTLWLEPDVVADEALWLRERQVFVARALQRERTRCLRVVADDLHDARLPMQLRRVLRFIEVFAPVPSDLRLAPQIDALARVANLLDTIDRVATLHPDLVAGLPPLAPEIR